MSKISKSKLSRWVEILKIYYLFDKYYNKDEEAPFKLLKFSFWEKTQKNPPHEYTLTLPFPSSSLGWKWWLKVLFRTKIFIWSLRRALHALKKAQFFFFLLNVFPSRSPSSQQVLKMFPIASHFIPFCPKLNSHNLHRVRAKAQNGSTSIILFWKCKLICIWGRS